MDIEVKAALYDIQQACQFVVDFIANSEFADYQADVMLKSAVERQFITIGEALNKAIRQKPNLNNQITDARKIIDFRNVLTHGYVSISDEVVWDIAQSNLPILLQEVTILLADIDHNQ